MYKKITNIFSNFKKVFNKSTLQVIKFVPRILKLPDKIVLLTLFGVIIVASFFIWQNHWIKSTHEAPAAGGTLIEGIVGQPKDLDKHISRLTGAGLTRLVENGDVKGDLAESWEVKDDGKTYQFKIRSGYSANDLLAQIQNKGIWSSIEMSAPDDQTLVFKFKAPFSPFLYVSTEPIFDSGPYKITKEQKDRVTLTANKNYWQGEPHIQTVQVNLYGNNDLLTKAINRNEVMSYIKDDLTVETDDGNVFSYNLPRELNLFFNFKNTDLQDINLRKNLRDNKNIGKTINLVLATSDSSEHVMLANQIKDKWAPLEVNVEVKTYGNVAIQKDIIPNRTYDLLLYGQDYGPDPDPYPFWHSSQITATGSNLSNFSNKPADKLLEDARQTFDFAIRDEKYKAFRAILDEQVPYINLKKYTVDYVISNKVKGVNKVFGYSESDRFLNISQWYIKSKRVRN